MKKKLVSLGLVIALLSVLLAVPASAAEGNPTSKTNNFGEWFTLDKEIISIEWDSFWEYDTSVVYPSWSTPPKITYYVPILYVPYGTTITLKQDKVDNHYYVTDQLSYPINGDNILGFVDNSYRKFTVRSADKTEYGVYRFYGSALVDSHTDYILTDYRFFIVGVDPNAPVVTYKTAIPELSGKIVFSNDSCGSYQTQKVTDVSTNANGELEIKRETVTVYEFPVGTQIKLTDDAVKNGYGLYDITGNTTRATELKITEASTRERTYLANSESDPSGVNFYIRGVNLNSVFSDVASGAYYGEAVKWAVRYGITSGTTATTFSPNQTCTTAQIITFMWRANGCTEPVIDNPFTDVKTSDYYYKAAVWASENHLISGDKFNGNTPCTRGETMKYLWTLAGQPEAGSSPFADAGEYSEAVAWAVQQGITSGTSATTFSPDATCTRAQIMTFLYRDMA